jgi:ribosome-associated toxin RatA of RatAB toxin-antitoxin module
MPRPARPALAALALAAFALAPGARAEEALPPAGQVEVKSFSVKDSDAPKIVVRAVLDVPAKKIWKIVSDCAHYKDHMPRIAASKLVKQSGNTYTCEVTVALPFPLSNLTGVTEAVHEESEKGMTRRWHLVSGDYKVNDGSWEVKPLGDGSKSLVVYTVHAEPKTAVPGWIRESAQKKALPEMIERVKAEASKLP